MTTTADGPAASVITMQSTGGNAAISAILSLETAALSGGAFIDIDASVKIFL